MRIAITAEGQTLASPVDPRFGRAAWFIVYDTVDKSARAVDNQRGQMAGQGAGVQAVETLAREGATALLTGHCGPNAFRALSAAGIQVFLGASGSVADAIQAHQDGALRAAAGNDVQGHWT